MNFNKTLGFRLDSQEQNQLEKVYLQTLEQKEVESMTVRELVVSMTDQILNQNKEDNDSLKLEIEYLKEALSKMGNNLDLLENEKSSLKNEILELKEKNSNLLENRVLFDPTEDIENFLETHREAGGADPLEAFQDLLTVCKKLQDENVVQFTKNGNKIQL
jgi:predicted RNase H-like nuclease (RuvC/YqgF family)